MSARFKMDFISLFLDKMQEDELEEALDEHVLVSLKDPSSRDFEAILHAVYAGKVYLFVKDKVRVLNVSSLESLKVIPSPTIVQTSETFKKTRPADSHTQACPQDVRAVYWNKRHFLFSLFDQGVQMDQESWFSVTPESIANHIASRLAMSSSTSSSSVLDCCCGVGGNVLAFSQHKHFHQVVGVDVVPSKLSMARHNSKIYQVDQRCEFVLGDCLHTLAALPDSSIDFIFLSPPWGGPDYHALGSGFSIIKHILLGNGRNGVDLFRQAARVCIQGVAFFLPRTVTLQTIQQELNIHRFELEKHIVQNREFSTCLYYTA